MAAFVSLAGSAVHDGPVTTDPVPDDGTTVRTERWMVAGRPVATVQTVLGGGHAWPSARRSWGNGATFGVVSRDLDASAAAIAFTVAA